VGETITPSDHPQLGVHPGDYTKIRTKPNNRLSLMLLPHDETVKELDLNNKAAEELIDGYDVCYTNVTATVPID
jgi:hypothetical protein